MAYERLSALDASFLDMEQPSSPMHLAATLIFERGPLARPDGSLDMARIRKVVAARLYQTPRLRKRVMRVPLSGRPVWVDDSHFQLDYHLRHMDLPAPGSRESLRELVGQVLSQPLDLSKPLWEIWVVDGLEGGRLAAICKMHHALMDGMAGVGAMSVILHPEPSREVPEGQPWEPEPAPSAQDFLRAEAGHRLRSSTSLLALAPGLLRHPAATLAVLRNGAEGVFEAVTEGLQSYSSTPLNQPIGPHRSVRWLRSELGDVKRVKQVLGGTVNDVVVAATAGGLRRFFQGRGFDPNGLACRAMVPVNTRGLGGAGDSNRLAAIPGRLPVELADPRHRLKAVRAASSQTKASRMVQGTQIVNALADLAPANLTRFALELAVKARSYNLAITNIPGPPVPLYMLEAPMLEVFPTMPLFGNQALSVAVFSYAGWLHWGFTADRELVPDLDEFATAVQGELTELSKLAATA